MRLMMACVFVVGAASYGTAAPPVKKGGASTKSRSGRESTRTERPAADKQSPGTVETLDPGVFLLRDPVVQSELKLNAQQKDSAAQLAADFNEPIWRFRDAAPESDVAVREARRLNALIEPRLAELLTAGQRDRLAGIALQVQGTSALGFASTGQKLSLTSQQQERIAKLSGGAQAAIKKLQSQMPSAGDVADVNRQAALLQAALQQDLQAVLTPTQQERWRELRGAAIDLNRLQPLTAHAPELRGVDAWINSQPLTFEALRGKVVALHFWTFG